MFVKFGNQFVRGMVLGNNSNNRFVDHKESFPNRDDSGFWWRSESTGKDHFISGLWNDTYSEKNPG